VLKTQICVIPPQCVITTTTILHCSYKLEDTRSTLSVSVPRGKPGKYHERLVPVKQVFSSRSVNMNKTFR